MQMSLRSRMLDLLPVMVVFALVTTFATFVVLEYVVREPIVVPPPQRTMDERVDARPDRDREGTERTEELEAQARRTLRRLQA